MPFLGYHSTFASKISNCKQSNGLALIEQEVLYQRSDIALVGDFEFDFVFLDQDVLHFLLG